MKDKYSCDLQVFQPQTPFHLLPSTHEVLEAELAARHHFFYPPFEPTILLNGTQLGSTGFEESRPIDGADNIPYMWSSLGMTLDGCCKFPWLSQSRPASEPGNVLNGVGDIRASAVPCQHPLRWTPTWSETGSVVLRSCGQRICCVGDLAVSWVGTSPIWILWPRPIPHRSPGRPISVLFTSSCQLCNASGLCKSKQHSAGLHWYRSSKCIVRLIRQRITLPVHSLTKRKERGWYSKTTILLTSWRRSCLFNCSVYRVCVGEETNKVLCSCRRVCAWRNAWNLCPGSMTPLLRLKT